MQKRGSYQKHLLEIVETLLEGSSMSQAHDRVHQWVVEMRNSARLLTLNDILWGSFVIALTDSVFYENEAYLHDTRELLLGHTSRNRFTAIFTEDYQSYFTRDEAEWYEHLLGMVDFLLMIPFAKLHRAISPALQNQESWETIREQIPEAAQIEMLEQDYEQRKARLEKMVSKDPAPENVGDEGIYHLVLREVAFILAEIWVVPAAARAGYPILGGLHSNFRGAELYQIPDMTEHILWAKRALEALRKVAYLFSPGDFTKHYHQITMSFLFLSVSLISRRSPMPTGGNLYKGQHVDDNNLSNSGWTISPKRGGQDNLGFNESEPFQDYLKANGRNPNRWE